MAMLEMMYVYFDVNGEIRSISPELSTLPEGQLVTSVLLSEVEEILGGKKNPGDYFVKTLKSATGNHYKITKKSVSVVNYVRTLDNFLAEIHTMPRSKDSYVLIENDIKAKKIKISLGKIVSLLSSVGDDEDQDRIKSFSTQQNSTLFFTKKSDPYFLLHTLNFSPQELFSKEELHFSYTVDLSEASVYTKRLLDRYSYKKVNNEF